MISIQFNNIWYLSREIYSGATTSLPTCFVSVRLEVSSDFDNQRTLQRTNGGKDTSSLNLK